MGEHLKRKSVFLEHEETANLKEAKSDLADDFQRLSQATQDIASDSLNAVKNEFGDLYKQGQKRMAKVGGQIESRIQSHPVQTLLIAAGIGFILGWLKRK